MKAYGLTIRQLIDLLEEQKNQHRPVYDGDGNPINCVSDVGIGLTLQYLDIKAGPAYPKGKIE